MFNKILRVMREKILKQEYVMTIHAEEEMDEDNLTIYDIETCILTGEILERQKDKMTNEWKYRIRGETIKRNQAEVIAKLGITNKLVIITVYLI